MAFALPHLHTAFSVEQTLTQGEPERLVCLRFGHDFDPECMKMDEVLSQALETVKHICAIYLIDVKEVPEFTQMYELYDPCTLMFFYKGKHMMIDLGTGSRNKINWALSSPQELCDILEAIHRGAQKGRDFVVAPKDYSQKFVY